MSNFENAWQSMIPAAIIATTTLSNIPGIPVMIQQQTGIWDSKDNSSSFYEELVGKSESLRALSQIQKLKDDWNGYGAKAVPTECILLARSIVMSLEHQPEIYPTGRSSIQMQYELQDRSYLEFEVFMDRIEVLMVPKRNYAEASEWCIDVQEYGKIREIVDDFIYS